MGRDAGRARRETHLRVPVTAVLAAVVAFLAASCAAGRLETRSDAGFERAFRSNEILAGYRYYVYPPTELPEAILGIREGLTLGNDLWRNVSMTPTVLRRYVDGLGQDGPGGVSSVPPPQAIVGPDGEVLGFWLSRKPLPPTKPPADGVITVPLPLAPPPGGGLPGRRLERE